MPGFYSVAETNIIMVVHTETGSCFKIASYLVGRQAKKCNLATFPFLVDVCKNRFANFRDTLVSCK